MCGNYNDIGSLGRSDLLDAFGEENSGMACLIEHFCEAGKVV